MEMIETCTVHCSIDFRIFLNFVFEYKSLKLVDNVVSTIARINGARIYKSSIIKRINLKSLERIVYFVVRNRVDFVENCNENQFPKDLVFCFNSCDYNPRLRPG